MLILAFCFLLAGYAWTEQEKLSVMISLFPGDEEIPGWRRAEKLLRATNEEELYKIFNGGAELYIQNGFHSYAGQSYRGPKGTELEVHIFHQTDSKNAESLYENRFTRPVRSKEIANLGEKARIDMTPLFCYGIDFIQQGFFVRVIIQERTEEGLKTAISFARSVGKRLPLAKPPRSPR